jgi:hypothetical protein|tara:strand:+ start:1292 stop:1525 length:234 start_codon:yes stop_codon:yes gene_type:complete
MKGLFMVPAATNPKWAQLVKGEVSYNYKFLALKIALTRYQNKVKFNEAPLNDVIKELVEFFQKNEALLADDIKTIFG